VTGFQLGDAVYYAGDGTRAGSNAQQQLVDSRIAAIRPKSLDAAACAGLPLTSLTAWESLFDRLAIDPHDPANAGRSLLIIGGAGGVGSIAIQLAKWAGLTVIATASRAESSAWCRELGADHVVNHHEPLEPQLRQLGFSSVDFIGNFNNTERYWKTMGELIAPQGRIVLIVEPSGPLEFGGNYKRKSVSVSWEFMFARPMFGTADVARQGEILGCVTDMIDRGILRATASTVLKPINAANLIQAHQKISSGATIGKIVIAGWD
jgi:NADPH2:quinone reductase